MPAGNETYLAYLRSRHVVVAALDVELGLLTDAEPDAAADVEPEVPAATRSDHGLDRVGAADVPVRIADDAVADVLRDLDLR